MINAPTLVLTAAGLSIIAKGGITSTSDAAKKNLSPGALASAEQSQVFKFWASIIFATGGIILIDRWNSKLATGLASLWLVGGVVINGPALSSWLSGFGKGVNPK